MIEDDGLEPCDVCGRRLKPICETKHHEGKCYCVDCYREKYLLEKLKKFREMERI